MTISELSVKNKAVVFVLLAIIVLVGAMSYITIPRESSPSITIPFVFVSTVYPGVSPEDMEKLVTMEIEKELKGVKDVKNISSTSMESFSSIIVEFNTNVKIEDALQRVRDKVSIAKADMPNDVEEPEVTEINLSELPILYVNLSGNYGLAEIKKVGDDLSDKIEGISGVLSADVSGGLEREVKVSVDANNIAFNDIIFAIKNENVNIPGGNVDLQQKSFTVKVPGEYKDPAKIANIVVKSPQGDPIFVRDVANVVYGFEDRTTYSRENGVQAVTIIVKKRSGENIIEINEKVKEVIADANIPTGLDVSFTGDESKNIKETVKELENGIITGFVLVVFILFSAMGFRNSLIVATSIPLSFLIAFSILALLGVTLNIVVLFALILVLGIIVDDAVVVNENIYRLQEKEGLTPVQAAIEGPREVQMPVFIATLTIIGAFFPLLFFPGIVGEFMKFLPITIITCLFASLFVAMVINPVFSSFIINVKKEKEKLAKTSKYNILMRYHRWFDRMFENVTHSYERFLRFLMQWRKSTILAVFGFLILVFVLYGGPLNTGMEFFPTVDPPSANINISMPVGTTIEKTNEVTKRIEEELPNFKEVEYYVTSVGQEISTDFTSSGGNQPNKSTITVNFYDFHDREESSIITVDKIRSAVTGITTADVLISQQAAGPPTGAPVNLELSGDDYGILAEYTDKIEREIRDVQGLTDLKDNLDRVSPEITFIIDREKAALYKLSTTSIASTIRTAVSGTEASTFRVGENEYDITVRLDSSQRNNVQDLANLYVADKDGILIPLSSVAKLGYTSGIGSIKRKDLKRVVTISGNVAPGVNAEDVLKLVQGKLKGMQLPGGYEIKYTGQQEEQMETQAFLGKAFGITILLVFFFLVMEFNNFSTTFIIMFSVILSLIGVLLGLIFTQTPFGLVMSGIGVISLAGIVVRNAIVLLDFQKELERRGMDRIESTIQSGKIRLRPVVLTAATTILGLVPLTTGFDFDWQAFHFVSGGQNTAFWQPMGTAIIFGLAFATFLTLVIIPVLYISVNNLLDRVFKRKAKDIKEGKVQDADEPLKPVTT
jgi:hydrophobe/amphiphile efflux-1 (HAE1) family protein